MLLVLFKTFKWTDSMQTPGKTLFQRTGVREKKPLNMTILVGGKTNDLPLGSSAELHKSPTGL